MLPIPDRPRPVALLDLRRRCRRRRPLDRVLVRRRMATRAATVRTGFPLLFRVSSGVVHGPSRPPGPPPGWTAARAWKTPAWSYLGDATSASPRPVRLRLRRHDRLSGQRRLHRRRRISRRPDLLRQATMLAETGQQAQPPATRSGSRSACTRLVQGQETTSNNIFQLAVDKNGVVRGNYYDGLMDTTTPVYGSVQQSTQRVAWTIGKAKIASSRRGSTTSRRSETPVLVHFGADRTQQMLFVRIKQPQPQITPSSTGRIAGSLGIRMDGPGTRKTRPRRGRGRRWIRVREPPGSGTSRCRAARCSVARFRALSTTSCGRASCRSTFPSRGRRPPSRRR